MERGLNLDEIYNEGKETESNNPVGESVYERKKEIIEESIQVTKTKNQK